MVTTRRFLALAAGAAGISLMHAQVAIQSSTGVVRLQNTDLAVLEAGEARKDLPCSVTGDKAFLGFDMRFHAGYDVSIPLAELAGNENLLTVLFRVAPADQPGDQRYFIQRIRVPMVEEEAKGDAFLQGGFDIGEGKYKVDWLIRDRAERVCSASWDVEATMPSRDKQVALAIAPQAIEQMQPEQFYDEPPVERTSGEPLINVKVLMNFAPQRATAATLRPLDTTALVSMLRYLSRDPRIGKFSVVAFNMQEQKVVFRQSNADRIDFKRLGESLGNLNPGTVRLEHLTQKHSDTQFLANLITSEFVPAQRPDAMVFAGPKVMLENNIPEENLRQIGEVEFPVFYMNYILNPQATPWRDAIGNAVKFFKGHEFTISRPRDLWYAVTDMVSRIIKFRSGKQVASTASGK